MTGIRRRIIVDRPGGPERLRLIEDAVPAPGPGELLIANEAVGVAFADVLIREGLYPGVRPPATPGYEAVGRVLAAGPGASDPSGGGRVAAMIVHGGYASHVTVRADACVPVPEALDSAKAAALVLNGVTALQMLTRCVAAGSLGRVLVWGAAGGVGSTLLVLARDRGIEALGVCSPSRRAFVEARGAVAIVRDPEAGARSTARSIARAAQAHGGVDAVFDGVGGANVRASLACLRSGGTVVMYGAQGALSQGRRDWSRLAGALLGSPLLHAHALFMRNVGLKGYLVEDWKRARPDLHLADLADILRLAAEGRVRPAIHAELPLADAAEAHRLLNVGAATGKLVLRP